MIKLIAFDCWGTLFGNSRRPHPFTLFAETIGQDINDRTFLQTFERHLMTDNHPDLKAPIRNLLDDYGVDSSSQLLLKLEGLLIDSADTQIAYPETLEVLRSLHQKYRLAMITNTFPQGFEGMCHKFALPDYFELILTSYLEHATKPNPAIFNKLLTVSGLEPHEILFIGDSLESDIVPTTKLGFSNLLIDRRGRYPQHAPRITSLLEIQL